MQVSQTHHHDIPPLPRPLRLTLPVLLFCFALNLPFVLPWHSLPFPSFSSEFTAYILGLVAVLSLLIAHRNIATIALPRSILTPIFLMLLVLVQWSGGYFAYASNAILTLIVAVWLGLLMIAGANLKTVYGLPNTVTAFAYSIMLGTVVSAMIGIVQFSGYAEYFAGLLASPMPLAESGVYGNIAQQNHYASYLAFGIGAVSYLRLKRQISSLFTLAIVILLISGLFLSASRSAYIYVFGFSLIALGLRVSSWTAKERSRLYLILIFGSGLILLVGWVLVSQGIMLPQLQRLFSLSESVGTRLFLWQHSIWMVQDSPLLGVGWDAFAWKLTEQIGLGNTPNVWGVDQYAHNIILQLLATTGVLGLLLISAPLVLSISWQSWRQWSSERIFVVALLAVLLIHSLLEQPLYFAYFSIYGAILMGFVDSKPCLIRWGRLQMVLLSLCVLVLLCFAAYLGSRYKQFEALFNHTNTNLGHAKQVDEQLQSLHHVQILKPLVEGYAPELIVPHESSVKEKLALNQRLIRFAPLPENMYRHAALLAENGQLDEAQHQLRKSILVYPNLATNYLERYRALAAENPALYAELAIFMEQEIDLYLKK